MLKWALYAAVAIATVVIAGVAFLMLAPPTGVIRSQAIAQVKAQTGRDLSIKGPTSFTLFPRLGVSMEKVSLSAPPDMGGAPLVEMDSLTVRIRLLPLLSRQVAVDTLVLENPVFNLRADAKGRKSWDFAIGPVKPARVQLAQADSQTQFDVALLPLAAQAAAGGTAAALDQLELGDVRIDNGTLNYTDDATGASERIDAINVTLGLDAIDQPLRANGDLRWKKEVINFDGTLTSVQSILKDRPAKLAVTVAAKPVEAQFNGALALAGGLSMDGGISAASKSVRSLAAWLGSQLPEASGYGAFNAKGRLSVQGATYSLIDADMSLDGATAKGTVSVETAGERPHVRADLRLSELDLNKYIGGGGDGTKSSKRATSGKKVKAKSAGQGKRSGGDGGAPQSIDDLLDRTQPQVRGYTKRNGWSNEPIDLSALKGFDANAKLAVGRLLFQQIKIDRTQLNVELKKAIMKTHLDEAQLYDGRGRGIVTVDANKAAAGVGLSMAVDGVSARPFLTDAAGIDRISGRGNLTIALSGRAGSERQLMETLGGTAKLNFLDGAIVGMNIPRAIRRLKAGQLDGLNQAETEKTDFSELSASFIVKNGIAENKDLKMLSPLMRVTGQGRIMLPPRRVDYTVSPKLVADLAGQGGSEGHKGIVIPVRVHGSFDNIKYTPDLAGVLSDPDAAVETVKKIGEQFKGKKAGEILDNLLGGGEDASGGDGKKKKIDAKKLLDGLFGD